MLYLGIIKLCNYVVVCLWVLYLSVQSIKQISCGKQLYCENSHTTSRRCNCTYAAYHWKTMWSGKG